MLFFAQCYFPASGYLVRDTGLLTSIGEAGYCWASSGYGLSSLLGGRLRLWDSWIGSIDGDYRSYGFPVRCVQAFTVIGLFCIAGIKSGVLQSMVCSRGTL